MCSGETGLLHDSHINLFIPRHDVVYLAPGRVDHYIDVHSYVPSTAFIDALMMCPEPGTAAYRAALFGLNKGQQPPLFLS